MKNKFEEITSLLPQDLVTKGNSEHRIDCIGLYWPGGSLFLGENGQCGEFILHIYQTDSSAEYYCPYPIYNKSGSTDIESFKDLISDISKYRKNLIG